MICGLGIVLPYLINVSLLIDLCEAVEDGCCNRRHALVVRITEGL